MAVSIEKNQFSGNAFMHEFIDGINQEANGKQNRLNLEKTEAGRLINVGMNKEVAGFEDLAQKAQLALNKLAGKTDDLSIKMTVIAEADLKLLNEQWEKCGGHDIEDIRAYIVNNFAGAYVEAAEKGIPIDGATKADCEAFKRMLRDAEADFAKKYKAELKKPKPARPAPTPATTPATAVQPAKPIEKWDSEDYEEAWLSIGRETAPTASNPNQTNVAPLTAEQIANLVNANGANPNLSAEEIQNLLNQSQNQQAEKVASIDNFINSHPRLGRLQSRAKELAAIRNEIASDPNGGNDEQKKKLEEAQNKYKVEKIDYDMRRYGNDHEAYKSIISEAYHVNNEDGLLPAEKAEADKLNQYYEDKFKKAGMPLFGDGTFDRTFEPVKIKPGETPEQLMKRIKWTGRRRRAGAWFLGVYDRNKGQFNPNDPWSFGI